MDWYVWAILGAIFTGFAAITQKRTLKQLHAMQFSTTLAIVNVLFSLPLFLIADFSNVNIKVAALMYVVSWLATVAFLYVSKSVRHMDISVSSPFLTFGPAMVAVLSFLFLGETITLWQTGGLLLVIIGAYTLEVDHSWGHLKEPFLKIWKGRYIHFIFLALLLYGFSSLIDRYLLNQNNAWSVDVAAYLIIVQGFVAMNFIMLTMIYHEGYKDIVYGFRHAGIWIFLVGIFTVCYRFFQGTAVAMENVALVSAIKRTSVLFATIVGGTLFHEKALVQKTVACMIMVAGSVLVIIG